MITLIRPRRSNRRLYISAIALIVLAFVSNASSQPSPPTTPTFLGPQVSAISNVKTGAFAKVGGGLARLYSEHATFLQQQQQRGFQALGKFAPSNPIVKMVDSSVVIDAVATDDAASLLTDLKALGLTTWRELRADGIGSFADCENRSDGFITQFTLCPTGSHEDQRRPHN